MLAVLLLAAAGRHHHRGHSRGGAVTPHTHAFKPPATLGLHSTTVSIADIEAFSIVTPGKRTGRTKGPATYESVVRVTAHASNDDFNGGELDFNLTVSYTVDGVRVGVSELGYKMRETNLGNGVPQKGAQLSKRVTTLGWDFRSLSQVETVCLTIRAVAWWVAADAEADESEPVDRCVALKEIEIGDLPTGSTPGRRGPRMSDLSKPTMIAPFPASLSQAIAFDSRGTRVQLCTNVAVAPAPYPPAPEVELHARFRLKRYSEIISPWIEVTAVPLGPLGDGDYAADAPGVPARARVWRLATTVWNTTSDAATLTDVWVHWELSTGAPGTRDALSATSTSAVCSQSSWFACTWTTPYRASVENDWAAQGGRMYPTYVPCDDTPTPALLAKLAHKHHAHSPFAPLDELDSLLRVEYDSPGGVFTECMQSIWNERMERRVHADQHSFRVDPFLGVQQIAPWSVRSAHLNSYSCNASETMKSQTYSGAQPFGGDEWLCLGSDNYEPAIGWVAKPGATYTLVAWSAPQPRMEDTTLQWLVVDIPGSDVARGTTMQRYIGPLSTGYFFNYTVVSFAVFEQRHGLKLSELAEVWQLLGLRPSAERTGSSRGGRHGARASASPDGAEDVRLGAPPISVPELIKWLGLSKPHAFTYFFTFTDFWTPFAMQYVYGDPRSAAEVCKTDMVNHIINPRGGYCTNGFGASPINAAWPYQYLRFDDNGLNPMILGICAANGFFYPEVQADGWQVNLTAIKSSLLVPSGKVIKDFGKVVTDCQPKDANVLWMGEYFCAGADFALPKYHMKVSMCSWDDLVPLADATTPDISHPPKPNRVVADAPSDATLGRASARGEQGASRRELLSALSALACVLLGAALTLAAEHVISPRVRARRASPDSPARMM